MPAMWSRTAGGFCPTAHYAADLNADVIAIQEVDGPGVAARIFRRPLRDPYDGRLSCTGRAGRPPRDRFHRQPGPDRARSAAEPPAERRRYDVAFGRGAMRILAVI